jgi:radical SAM superfamily enzyme YgiQ (UPF0313 family)
MRVLLISANTERINMPALPLGLGCIAEATRQAGHQIEMLDLLGSIEPGPAIKDAIEKFHPEVLAVSIRNIDDQKMEGTKFLLEQLKEVVSICRSASNAPIVLGGAGYSICPESSLEYLEADMGIQGEGEAAFTTLLEHMQNHSSLSTVPGLYLRENGLQAERRYVQNLDELPLPAPDLWNPSYANESEFWMPVQTRRGCSMDCSYCSTAAIEGRLVRKRSPEIVVRWMQSHIRSGFRRFYFTDNNFNLPGSYARELCEQMLNSKLDISWRCIIYPVKLDEELVRKMAKSGCKEVSLGAESGAEQILHSLNKKFKPQDIRHTSGLFKQYGVKRMGFLLLGAPGETKETVEESLAFADSLNLDMLKISIGIRIYPNTKLAETAVKEGKIAQDDDLLFPKFYLQDGLEDWLRGRIADELKKRKNWFM